MIEPVDNIDIDFCFDNEAAAIDAAASEDLKPKILLQDSKNAPYKQIVVKFLSVGVGFADSQIPHASDFYHAKAIDTIADSIIRVCDIEGWDLDDIINNDNSRIGAWVALAIAVGLPGYMLWQSIKASKAKIAPTNTGDTGGLDGKEQ